MRRFLLSAVFASLGLSGCGGCNDDGSRRLADAPPPDVGEPIDAADKPVTLTVTKNGAPVAGVLVYFQNGDSSLVKKADTDINGKASAVMMAGGFVTAIDPFADESPQQRDNDLRTFSGVKPGDDLVLTTIDLPPLSVTLTIPTDPNASEYDISTTCGSGAISTGGEVAVAAVGIVELHGCGAMVDIMVIARDSVTGTPRSALYHPNIPLLPAIDLSADTFRDLSDVTFNFLNVPDVGSLPFGHSLASTRGAFAVPFRGDVTLESGNGTAKLREPTVAGAVGIFEANLFTGSRHYMVDWGAAAAAYTLDMDGLLLRNVSDDAVYTAAINQVTWTESVDGAEPDLTFLSIDVAAASERTWHWAIAAPYAVGVITYPVLPIDVADWNPGPTDSVQTERLVNAKVTGGYDAVRARVHDIRSTFQASSRFLGFVRGPTGRAMVVQPEPRGDPGVSRSAGGARR